MTANETGSPQKSARKRNLLRFAIGVLAGILIAVLIPLAILAAGLIDMSAAAKPGKMESAIAPWALARSMARRAPEQSNPFANDPSVLPSGLAHYRVNCVLCHGAPDVEPAELAQGLNPPAPALESAETQSLADGQIFWIVKNGIRLTGMPAFGPTHGGEEIWHIVAFVRHLPKITEEEKKAFESETKEEVEHHHEGAPEAKESKNEHGDAHDHDSPATSGARAK